MVYRFHINKMKSLRRITRCLYGGSVFYNERAVSSRRWRHTSRFSITVPCKNVADLIMKDFGKFSNKVALVSTLSKDRIYPWSDDLLKVQSEFKLWFWTSGLWYQLMTKNLYKLIIDVFEGVRSLDLLIVNFLVPFGILYTQNGIWKYCVVFEIIR